MSDEKHASAFPVNQKLVDGLFVSTSLTGGLSKREYFACATMQALLTGGCIADDSDDGKTKGQIVAERAVQWADYLILELAKGEG